MNFEEDEEDENELLFGVLVMAEDDEEGKWAEPGTSEREKKLVHCSTTAMTGLEPTLLCFMGNSLTTEG